MKTFEVVFPSPSPELCLISFFHNPALQLPTLSRSCLTIPETYLSTTTVPSKEKKITTSFDTWKGIPRHQVSGVLRKDFLEQLLMVMSTIVLFLHVKRPVGGVLVVLFFLSFLSTLSSLRPSTPTNLSEIFPSLSPTDDIRAGMWWRPNQVLQRGLTAHRSECPQTSIYKAHKMNDWEWNHHQ